MCVCLYVCHYFLVGDCDDGGHLFQTNSKIMIRGKGATKEGKFKGLPQPGEDEPLHALITANTPEAVKIAVDKVTHLHLSLTLSLSFLPSPSLSLSVCLSASLPPF